MSNMNWKYLISNHQGEVVIIRKEFEVPYFENWTSWRIEFFNLQVDKSFVDNNYKEYPINFSYYKELEKGYFPTTDSSIRKDGIIISALNKIFPSSKIHNKGEVSIYLDKNKNRIFEVNSLYRIKEFWDNFLQFKEFVMFSPTFLINKNTRDICATFVEKNIELFDKWINVWNKAISIEKMIEKYNDKEEWVGKLSWKEEIVTNQEFKLQNKIYDDSWTTLFIDNIFNLQNGKFYWVDNNIFLYYFLELPSWYQLLNPYIKENSIKDYSFEYEPTNIVFPHYSNITEKIQWLKSYKEKQWDDYLFWVNFHKFEGISVVSKETSIKKEQSKEKSIDELLNSEEEIDLDSL